MAYNFRGKKSSILLVIKEQKTKTTEELFFFFFFHRRTFNKTSPIRLTKVRNNTRFWCRPGHTVGGSTIAWKSVRKALRNDQYHFTPIRMLLFKNNNNKEENKKYWWRCGETGSLVHRWWGCKMVQLLWKSSSRIQQLPCSKDLKAEAQTDTRTWTFTAALFTRAKRWKQPKYPLTDQ